MATYIPQIELEETESPEALQLSVAEYYRDLLRRRKSTPPRGGCTVTGKMARSPATKAGISLTRATATS